MKRTQWRLSWKREGHSEKHRTFQSEAAARKWALILKGDLAAYHGADPDDYVCCDGRECGCQAETYAEHNARVQAGLPPIVGPIRLIRRTVTTTPWEAVDALA